MVFLTAKYFCNLSAYQIVKILTILHNAYILLKDQNKNVFYTNNYINCNQCNQLYALDWMKKEKKNAKIVAQKLKLALTKVNNQSKKKLKKNKKRLTDKKQRL